MPFDIEVTYSSLFLLKQFISIWKHNFSFIDICRITISVEKFKNINIEIYIYMDVKNKCTVQWNFEILL